MKCFFVTISYHHYRFEIPLLLSFFFRGGFEIPSAEICEKSSAKHSFELDICIANEDI